MIPGRGEDPLAAIRYDGAPAILVIADGAPAFERARATVAAAGCRVAEEVPLPAAVARLRAGGAPAVLVELDGDDPALDAVLDELGEAAAMRRGKAVISAPEAQIDVIAARAWQPGIAHLCRAGEAERIVEVAGAATPRQPRLNDIGRDGTAILHQLSEEVGRIASILASLSEEEGLVSAASAQSVEEEEGGEGIDALAVRAIIRARRLRDQFFRPGLFADPAWDMLLDLLAARLEGHRVAVSSLCIAAAVPPTTALRWIKMLTDQGLLVRLSDPEDGRRVYIELSEEAARAMLSYLRAVQRLSPLAV